MNTCKVCKTCGEKKTRFPKDSRNCMDCKNAKARETRLRNNRRRNHARADCPVLSKREDRFVAELLRSRELPLKKPDPILGVSRNNGLARPIGRYEKLSSPSQALKEGL